MKNTKDTRAVPSYNGLRVKEQLRLLPGHLIVGLWCLFTLGMLLWIVAASLSTSPEIMRGEVLKFATGLHPENYVKAWTANNISVFFLNSLLYSTCTMIGSLLISAPAAYVLGRFVFRGNKVVRSGFITAMSLPHIMIVMPLFSMATRANLTGSKIVLIFIYIGMQVPYTTTFLISFFSSLSRVYEEAAAIDGCPPDEDLLEDHAAPGPARPGHCGHLQLHEHLERILPVADLCLLRAQYVRRPRPEERPHRHAVHRRLGRPVCSRRHRLPAHADPLPVPVQDHHQRHHRRRCQGLMPPPLSLRNHCHDFYHP